jgi:HK97 family phage portal protein
MVDLHPEVLDREHLLTLRADEAAAWTPGYSYLTAIAQYEGYVWVHKAVKALADNFAPLPYRVKRGDELTSDHPLLRLLTDVNDAMSSADLRHWYMSDMLLGGESGFELVRDKRRRYVEVWPRQPHTIKIVPDKARKRYYKVDHYTIDDMLSAPYDLPHDELIHFKFYNPRNPWRGLAPGQAAQLSIVIDQLSQMWSRYFFRNNARPDYAIISTAATRGEREEIQKQVMEEYSTVRDSHKPIVLEKDISDIKIMSYPPKDLWFDRLREMSRDEVGAIYGVPDMVMGFGADTYDTEEKRTAALRMLWLMTLLPLTRHHDTRLTEFFRGVGELRPDESIISDTSSVDVLQGDFGKKIEQANTLWGLGVPFNTINRRLGLGFEDVPGGDVGYLPLNLAPLGAAQPPAGGDKGKSKTLALYSRRNGHARKDRRVVEFGGEEHKRLYELFKQRLDPRQRRVQAAVTDIFEQQRDEVMDELERADGDADLRAVARDPFDREAWQERAAAIVLPVLTLVMTQAGQDALDDLDWTDTFDGELPEIVEAMRRQAQTFAERIDDTTWDRLRNSLGDGLQEGEGVNALMERVEQVMGDRIRSSAEAIARTETLRATGRGTQAAWEQSGIVESKQWISALIPGRTRADHAAAHGQIAPLGEPFDVGGEALMFPGDEAGSAENTINCLCTETPVLSEARALQLRRGQAPAHSERGQATGEGR